LKAISWNLNVQRHNTSLVPITNDWPWSGGRQPWISKWQSCLANESTIVQVVRTFQDVNHQELLPRIVWHRYALV
jgi:hypothetical protein